MLVGRVAEAAAVEGLLDRARRGESGVLVVRGEAGIGKSALLAHARERAQAFTVLHGVGIESETELAFAGLHQLLHPVLGRLETLPEPQAAALRAALALSAETVEDGFRVAVGVHRLLCEVAEEQPLLCVVDDAQWLDRASVDALLFAARRLQAESIAVLLAARDDPLRPFLAAGLPELRLAPLDPAEARGLASGRLDPGTPDDTVGWLVELAQGNPLALIELAAAAPLPGSPPPSTSVEEHFSERIRVLPQPVRRLLVLAAAEETGSRATIVAAGATLGVGMAELEAAESAGLIRVEQERVEFHHPLVRSAAYRSTGFAERERAHEALAAVLDAETDGDRRAWHRAAAAAGPDEDVAAELERTAGRARTRGGPGAAAAALVRASELSVDDEARGRRLVLAASSAHHAGEGDRALALAERAETLVADPGLRAQLALVHGETELLHREPARASDLLTAAAEALAPHEPARTLELSLAAVVAAAMSGDPARVARAHRAAGTVTADPADERQVLLEIVLAETDRAFNGARGGGSSLRAEHLGVDAADDLRRTLWAAATVLLLGDWDGARALYARAISGVRGAGAIGFLPHALAVQGLVSLMGGHVADAAAQADEAVRLAEDMAAAHMTAYPLGVLSGVAALQGRDDDLARLSAQTLERARPRGLAVPTALTTWAPAMLALGRGRWDEALAGLIALRDVRLGFGHPQIAMINVPNLVEAAARAGRPEAAAEPLAAFSSWAEEAGAPFVQARLARCRALLASGEAAVAELEEALRLHPADDGLFERARTQLLLGEALRRVRKRSEARDQLRAALLVFDQHGLAPWADRATSELRATGETARRRDPSTLGQLTPQEQQIARLVGEGASNKDVAAQLFLSPRTVEYHLRKVFQKLGIASRSELIRQGIGTEHARVPQ